MVVLTEDAASKRLLLVRAVETTLVKGNIVKQ